MSGGPPAPWRVSDRLLDDAVQLLRDLVRTDTTNPGMPEAPAASLVEQFLGRHGVQTRRFEPEPGRASVAARVAGNDAGAPALLLLSHLDAVAVGNPESWRHGPFSAEVDGGFIHGRGTIDDKGRTAINAAALAALSRDPPPGDVLFVAAADEEQDGSLGVGWLREHRPDVLDASFALGEGGGYRTEFGGRGLFTYAVAEKGAFRLKLAFTTPAASRGHASVPAGENAAEAAARAAALLAQMRWRWTRTAATDAMLRRLSASGSRLRGLGRRALGVPVAGPMLLRRGVGMTESQRRALHAMFHTTVTLTALESGHAAGGIPDQASALFSVRHLPGTPREQVLGAIMDRLAAAGLRPEVTVSHESQPREAAPDSPLSAALRETMAELDPGSGLLPMLLPASTDLRFLRPGAVSYGFTPMRAISAEEAARLAHGPNERIAIDDVRLGIEATQRIAHRLGRSGV